jgi:predicted transport protein
LLFEVSIDPKESEGRSVQQIAEQFSRFSRDAMARGVLDEIGERVFTTGKIRKALDKLFLDPPDNLMRIIRSALGDESIKPAQVRAALRRLWAQSPEVEIASIYPVGGEIGKPEIRHGRGKDYGEDHHVEGKPREVIELFRTIDKFCRELDPTTVQRRYLAKYVSYVHGKVIFCCVHLQKSGLRIWLKLHYSSLENPPDYVRDVSNIGHWGVGEVEIGIDNLEKLQISKLFIRQSFEENK